MQHLLAAAIPVTRVRRAAQVQSWEPLDVNWTPDKTAHFRACYLMAWLLAGCFQVTFLFLLLGRSLLTRLFAEPMAIDEPIPCAPAASRRLKGGWNPATCASMHHHLQPYPAWSLAPGQSPCCT